MPITPELDQEQVRQLLASRFRAVSDIRPLRPGELSRVYAFDADGEPYVVRFATFGVGFQGDAHAYAHFARPDVPVPRIHEIGQLGELHFAISERLPGTPFFHLPREEQARATPSLLATLDAIGRIDVSDREGYGYLDADRRGTSPSWRVFLASIGDDPADGFWKDWRQLFDGPILERDVWERHHEEFLSLLPHLPETRGLIHGDYGYDNVLIEDGRVTGVLDWANVKYGDPLFDHAYLSFWMPAMNAFPGDPRVRAYHLYMGLDGLRFYAKSNQPDKYVRAKEQLASLL